jgi:hypothetical protein
MRKKILIILLAFGFFACKKEPLNPADQNPLAATAPPITVTVDPTQQGYALSSTFEGLSYETAILTTDPDVLNINNKVLIQMIKNLGPGFLRIGGDSSDEISWTGGPRTSTTPNNVLTTTDIDRLSAFAGATGWQVLFGLNLGNDNMYAAANEAQYVYNSLGSSLYALQAGNEPDIYSDYGLRGPGYTYDDYEGDWLSYFTAVNSLLPQVSFAGPDVADNIEYIRSFAENENKNVRLIDAHYYLTGPASSPSITYKTILASSSGLPNYLQIINTTAAAYHLPYRITESNNVYGGGKQGVSDVFASALWALDLMWTIAENNGQGINFHGGSGLYYSPVSIENGILTAMPEYYAMLAFKSGSTGGTIIPAVITNPTYNCSAYACANADNTWSLTLINKEEGENIPFTIQSGKNASSIQVVRLTAPAVTSATGTKFAGSSVNSDGTFNPTVTERYSINKNSFTVMVPAGSAAVVTVQ